MALVCSILKDPREGSSQLVRATWWTGLKYGTVTRCVLLCRHILIICALAVNRVFKTGPEYQASPTYSSYHQAVDRRRRTWKTMVRGVPQKWLAAEVSCHFPSDDGFRTTIELVASLRYLRYSTDSPSPGTENSNTDGMFRDLC